jgi:hypothetical protein
MKRMLFDGLATQGTSRIRFHGGGEYAKYILRKAIEAGYRNFDVVFSKKMLIDKNIKDLVENTEGIEIFYVDDLANRILQVTYNHGLYASLVAGGYRQYQGYQDCQQPEMIKEIFGSVVNV